MNMIVAVGVGRHLFTICITDNHGSLIDKGPNLLVPICWYLVQEVKYTDSAIEEDEVEDSEAAGRLQPGLEEQDQLSFSQAIVMKGTRAMAR